MKRPPVMLMLLLGLALSSCAAALLDSPSFAAADEKSRANLVPQVVAQRLPNGIDLAVIRDASQGEFTASVLAPRGFGDDPIDRAGLHALLANLLSEGSDAIGGKALRDHLAQRGLLLSSEANADGSRIFITGREGALDEALGLLAVILRSPRLTQADLEHHRQVALAHTSHIQGDPPGLARLVAMRALFGKGRYGSAPVGTAASLRAVTLPEIREAYSSAWHPSNVSVHLTGAVTPHEGLVLTIKHFGTWATPAWVTPNQARETARPLPRRVIVVDDAGAENAAIHIVRGAMTATDGRWFSGILAAELLSERVKDAVGRTRLTGVSGENVQTLLEARRDEGLVGTAAYAPPGAVSRVLAIIEEEKSRLIAEGPGEQELRDIREKFLQRLLGSIEDSSGLSVAMADQVLVGNAPEELADFIGDIEAVDPSAVQSVAQQLFTPGADTIVIVGDASKLVQHLQPARRSIEIIKIADLDLDNPPSLRRVP